MIFSIFQDSFTANLARRREPALIPVLVSTYRIVPHHEHFRSIVQEISPQS